MVQKTHESSASRCSVALSRIAKGHSRWRETTKRSSPRALVRLCLENLFLVAELCARGSEVVKRCEVAMQRVGFHSAKSGLKEPGVADSEERENYSRRKSRLFGPSFQKPRKLSASDTAKGLMEQAYRAYALLSHDPVHPSIDALRRHSRPMRERIPRPSTMHVIPPFKPKERLDTIDKGVFALLGVCVGSISCSRAHRRTTPFATSSNNSDGRPDRCRIPFYPATTGNHRAVRQRSRRRFSNGTAAFKNFVDPFRRLGRDLCQALALFAPAPPQRRLSGPAARVQFNIKASAETCSPVRCDLRRLRLALRIDDGARDRRA